MKRNYADPELKVTRFEYENIMIDTDDGGIPDTGASFGDGDNEVDWG